MRLSEYNHRTTVQFVVSTCTRVEGWETPLPLQKASIIQGWPLSEAKCTQHRRREEWAWSLTLLPKEENSRRDGGRDKRKEGYKEKQASEEGGVAIFCLVEYLHNCLIFPHPRHIFALISAVGGTLPGQPRTCIAEAWTGHSLSPRAKMATVFYTKSF